MPNVNIGNKQRIKHIYLNKNIPNMKNERLFLKNFPYEYIRIIII